MRTTVFTIGETMRNDRWTALGTIALAALVLPSCAGQSSSPDEQAAQGESADECGPLPEPTSISVGTNPGVQDLLIRTAVNNGLAEKYNLRLDVHEFLNPPAASQAITQRAVEVGFGGLTTMTQARASGTDVLMIGALTTPANGVFVPEDSEIQNVGDLDGKKIGSFTSLSGAITSLVQVVAQSEYDLDLLSSSEVVVAPDAALVGVLDNGEIDAMILGVDATAVAQTSDGYRQILDLRTDFTDAMGFDPLFLGPVTTDTYANEHCSEIRAYLSTIRDAKQFVLDNDEVWTSYAEQSERPESAEAFRDLYTPTFLLEWGEEEVQEMRELIEVSIPLLGDEFPDEIPDGLFSTDYPTFDE